MELKEIEFMISDLTQGLNAEFTQPRVKTSHRHKGTKNVVLITANNTPNTFACRKINANMST